MHQKTDSVPSVSRRDGVPCEELRHAFEEAAELLPAQGPITVFVHHNTLHAFEHLPFHEAVVRGAELFGCEPYLSEDRYREELARGRIRRDDLYNAVRADLGERADELIGGLARRLDLRMAMLEHPLQVASPAELRWFVAETEALRCFLPFTSQRVQHALLEQTRHWALRDLRTAVSDNSQKSADPVHRAQLALAPVFKRLGASSMENWSRATWEMFCLQALWRACRDGVHGVRPFGSTSAAPRRHRDVLLAVSGADSDLLVHDVLIRFCAAFLDQGFSQWPLAERPRGMLAAFSALYRRRGGSPDAWLHGLRKELVRLADSGQSAEESVIESLSELGVPPSEWKEYVTATLLALRGWAGMIRQLEIRADRVACPVPPGTLMEFLAIRLLLERLALAYVAREHLGYTGTLARLRDDIRAGQPGEPSVSVEQRAFTVFQLAQIFGWGPRDLYNLSKSQWSMLVEEIESFPHLERRRLLHLAYERRFRVQVLDALSIHTPPASRTAIPKFQIACCLDEREESLRRHLEELCPELESFGVAGFFAAAMYYRGAADAHFVPLCPVVIQPQHWVTEQVEQRLDEVHRRRARTRRLWGALVHQFHVGSRSFASGALLTGLFGALASIPLVARVLFPRFAGGIRNSARRLLQPPDDTRLQLERTHGPPGSTNGHVGFTVEEMTSIGERLLRDMGLTKRFARLVLLLGHGSTSVNNPHKSAYDCGACGGSAGGPNARAVAQMLNDPRVRRSLAARGISIPASTYFVGALHNTCSDGITFYDRDRLPSSHEADFCELEQLVEEACDRNAHERCRRFQSAPLGLTFSAARRHVEGRAEDLAQTRPELGHATNAIAIVGRRARTRGLFLDRRAFLTSYDPATDDAEGTVLERVLQAVVPVCAGINLEYFFSYVDSSGWGCGTKLPHNVTSLLGVMDGAASDLRPGLPWQMVEIHEPVRLLLVVEAPPELLKRILARNAALRRLADHEWVQLASLDPDSTTVHTYERGEFARYEPEASELPVVDSSFDWYRGWRGHLEFAVIRAAESELSHTGQGDGVLIDKQGQR